MNIPYGVLLLVLLLTSCTCNEINVDNNGGDVDFQFIYQLHHNNLSDATSKQAGKGLIKFEEQPDKVTEKYNFVSFKEDNQSDRIKFEDHTRTKPEKVNNSNEAGWLEQNDIVFKDDDIINGYSKKPGKRRKRRRKSRRWMLAGASIPQISPSQIPSFYPASTFQPDKKGRPDLASLKAVTGPLGIIGDALASIIENDTKQCVMRMLCEQATGNQLSQSSLPSSIAYLIQYLPGITKGLGLNGFPIFKSVSTFALATLIGSETHNTTACEQKFSVCPSDPEERIHYLNNYNGGLFRFFKGTEHHQYSPAEFHNYLVQMGLPTDSGQNGLQQPYPSGQYGVYTPGQSPYGAYQGYPGQYGLQQPYANAQQPYASAQQPYASPQQPIISQQLPNYLPVTYRPDMYSHLGINGGFSRPNLDLKRPNKAPESQPNYAAAYQQYRRFSMFDLFSKKTWNRKKKIQKRILTNSSTTKKPKIYNLHFHTILDKMRSGKFKFPGLTEAERNVNFGQQGKGFIFPGKQSNRQYWDVSDSDTESNDESSSYDSENNRYVSDDDETQSYETNEEEGVQTVYIIRGNGDPNHPEIIKLRPGEKIF